jgi:hypothetical protein
LHDKNFRLKITLNHNLNQPFHEKQLTIFVEKNMISTGQLIFAILFIIAFTAVLIYVYRKDLPWQREHYKGTRWVLLGFMLFILFLFFVKFFLKN